MNTYWISLPCDLLSSLASFQCSLLHHLHLSSDLGLSKYVNQHSHLNLSRNVRLSVLYDLDFNMLALVVLNYSITRPPSFHLPFICHPSFMAFVKLKRSWFSCGTSFTSQVSLAMDSSLCLQMTSNFPLWVQLMLCPFPIITDLFMGTKL